MDNLPLTDRFEAEWNKRWCFPLICRLMIVIFLMAGTVQTVLAQEDKNDLINLADSLYVEGKLDEAELTALRALQNSESLPPIDRARLYRILGFTYVAQGENQKAKRQFINWLQIDPLANLDPLYISPKIINVFTEAQQEYKNTRTPPLDYANLNMQMRAVRRSLIFPGLGQLYREQQIKGFALVASEIILLGSLTYCQIKYDQARDRYLDETNPAVMQSRYDDCNLYYHGRNASIILAAGVYLYSLFDIMYFHPQTEPNSSPLSMSITEDFTPSLSLRLTLPEF